jgi:hypothetical protein
VVKRRCRFAWIHARSGVSAAAAALLALLVGVPIQAWDAVDHDALWRDAQTSLFDENRPLKALAMMEAMTRTGGMHTSTLAQFHAITGDLIAAEALAYAAVPQDSAPVAEPVDCHAWQRVPAFEAIEALAGDARVVMINESHFVPLHRAFSRGVVMRLRSLGFTHFGAETFVPDVAERVQAHRTAVSTMGVYSTDPVFGDLLRTALSNEYTLFPYEQTPSQHLNGVDPAVQRAMREQAQAGNIYRVLRSTADARLIIHAGGGHASEDPGTKSQPMMAYRFKALSGIDPVTVDQIGGTPISARKLQGALYRGVERCGAIVEPVVLRGDDGRLLARDGYDVTVFYPHVDYRTSRPDWLQTLLGRRLRTIRLEAHEQRTLVRAFRPDDPSDAIAVDQMLVPPDAVSVTLALPPGSHRLLREWDDGRQVLLGIIDVDADD